MRRRASKSTISRGRAAWLSTAAVRPPLTLSHFLSHTGAKILSPFLVVFGPAAATWYKILQRNVNFRSSTATVAARVACDQLLFAPTFIGIFLSSMAILEGTSPREKLEKTYGTALRTNYYVWPLVQGVNFKLVPLEHRVLFVNVISIGWNCYLSFLNNSG